MTNEIRELERRGHRVSIYALAEGRDDLFEGYEDLSGRVGRATDRSDYVGTAGRTPRVLPAALDVAFHLDSPVAGWRALRYGAGLMNFVTDCAEPVDHVHTHFATPQKLGAAVACERLGIPFSVTAHAFEIFQSPDEALVSSILDAASNVVVPSEYNREFVEEVFAFDTPVATVPATTPVERIPEPTTEGFDSPPELLTVADLRRKKGHRYALKALPEISDSFPDVTYRIVGDGRLKAELVDLATDLGVKDHVVWEGRLPEGELVAAYADSDLFVLPCVVTENGDRDVIPVVLKEAMLAGTPCVSTWVSGIPELIDDGENGQLVPPRNASALADAVTRILGDHDRYRRMQRKACSGVREGVTIEDAVDTLERVFEGGTTEGSAGERHGTPGSE